MNIIGASRFCLEDIEEAERWVQSADCLDRLEALAQAHSSEPELLVGLTYLRENNNMWEMGEAVTAIARLRLGAKREGPSACEPLILWQAGITYRSRSGLINKAVDLEKLEDLHEVVERGPHWDSISTIVIQRFNPIYPGLAVEQVELL